MEEYIMGNQLEPWKGGIAQTITFVITQDCNLRCKYCYMTDKNKNSVMSMEIGEKAIDYFLTNSDVFISDAVILEFIDGEPLLEIDLIDRITDYFKLRAYQLNHKWFTMYRISISTNGLLYSTEKVQKFIKKNLKKLSIGISIDGTKEKNDTQRVYPDGRGSYDDVVKNIELWQSQFPGASTKVTIGHDDLPYVKESIIHLWNLGLREIPANVVFEDVWKEGDDIIFYNQLKELADYIVDNDMWKDYNTSLFSQGIGAPLNEEELNKNSCGTGSMIAVDAKGNFYPCVRFMDYSLNRQQSYITGNIEDGINRDKVRPFYVLTTKNQSDNECLTCSIASGCQWCTGYNYDQSENGTLFSRDKSICKMHKARVKANNYLWYRLTRERGVKLKRNRGSDKYLFIMLADNSVSFCNYEASAENNISLAEEYLTQAAKDCFENFITPVILHSNNKTLSVRANEIFKGLDYINIYTHDNIDVYSDKDIIYHDSSTIYTETTPKVCCILKVDESELQNLSNYVSKALEFFDRVNINLIYNLQTFDINLYQRQLHEIADRLFEYYKNGNVKQVNAITDELLGVNRRNCNFGYKNFVLAPNGKIYSCPAMYYDKKESYLTDLKGLATNSFLGSQKFNLYNNAVCKQCNILHCNWCFYLSKQSTGEFSVPSSKQCQIAQIEKGVTAYLFNLLQENDIKDFYMNKIENTEFEDPILSRKTYSTSLMNFSYKV